MRKLIFIGFIVLGALVGLLSSAKADWGTRLVMMGVGALFAAPIGGALAGIGKSGRSLGRGESLLPSDGTSSKDLAAMRSSNWDSESTPKPMGLIFPVKG